jgi:glycine dehydrogenase subunit 2
MTATVTGNKGLQIEEGLLFDIGSATISGIDIEDFPDFETKLAGLENDKGLGLMGLSEPEAVRHYTRLSQKNYGIDMGFYPLGSCTMKYNPRLNEQVARLNGLANVHPFQPMKTAQGALELLDETAHWLKEITGMSAVAMSPAAGAHGELCGMMAIKAAHVDSGEDESRKVVLVPQSAHGTNPSTAFLCGYKIESLPADEKGRVDMKAYLDRLWLNDGKDIAAFMLTNPNTCGLFENDIVEIAEQLHKAGGYFYLDGANFNAIMGRVRISDLGVDAMHINIHKTFSTPHGGGGPGAGPTVFCEKLSKFAPLPWVSKKDGYYLVEHKEEAKEQGANPFGRMKGFHGQFGVYVRALSYMMSMGLDGLRKASGDAVLNANYIKSRLKDVLSLPFGDGYCMHEVLFDDGCFKGSEVTTLDFAKALLDEGFHPMTMYFPLVVHGAMLVEPTETESKKTLDMFCDAVIKLMEKVKSGDDEFFKQAPKHTPVRRMDETSAARKPVLTCCSFVK